MNWTIRARLAFSFSFLVGLILLAYSFALYAAISYSLEKEFRHDLLHEARWIAEVVTDRQRSGKLESLPTDLQDLDANVRVLNLNGAVLFDSNDTEWAAFPVTVAAQKRTELSPSWRRLDVGGVPHDLLIATLPVPNARPLTVEMLASHRDVLELKRTFSFWMLLLVPIAMILTVIAGLIYARRTLAPIDVIRRKADGITAVNLGERLPIPVQHDELYLLTETLNRLLARIDAEFSKAKRFTADASHELRNPVTILKGSVDVALRRDRSKEEYQSTLTDMREEVDALASLVDDLLTLSRADSGERTLAAKRVRLDVLLADVIAAGTVLNAGKVKLSVDHALEREIVCDPERLKRALLNLVHNAIKFTPPGGSVTVGGHERNSGVAIEVRDSGPGIPPQDQEKIFDRFYRTDEARSRDAGGTGLGLAIARTIAEAHGGTLTVVSATGQGSAFWLTLPVASILESVGAPGR